MRKYLELVEGGITSELRYGRSYGHTICAIKAQI